MSRNREAVEVNKRYNKSVLRIDEVYTIGNEDVIEGKIKKGELKEGMRTTLNGYSLTIKNLDYKGDKVGIAFNENIYPSIEPLKGADVSFVDEKTKNHSENKESKKDTVKKFVDWLQLVTLCLVAAISMIYGIHYYFFNAELLVSLNAEFLKKYPSFFLTFIFFFFPLTQLLNAIINGKILIPGRGPKFYAYYLRDPVGFGLSLAVYILFIFVYVMFLVLLNIPHFSIRISL